MSALHSQLAGLWHVEPAEQCLSKERLVILWIGKVEIFMNLLHIVSLKNVSKRLNDKLKLTWCDRLNSEVEITAGVPL